MGNFSLGATALTNLDKHIAITGARGRLAQLVAAFFQQQGYRVTLFSRRADHEIKSLEELMDASVLSTFTHLIHMAWSSVPFTSEQNPGCEEREDIPFLKKLLASVGELDPLSRPTFMFLSSASVYGNTSDQPVTENIPCHPLSGYARAKLQAEKLIQEALCKSLILRVTNVIGFPSDPKKPQGILPRILAAAEDQQSLEIWGDGNCYKDYLWIDDFLTALKVSIKDSLCGLFNVGSGSNFSLSDFITLIEEQKKKRISVIYRPHYSWDVSKAVIDSTAFRKATGWQPQVDIASALQRITLR